MRRSGGGLLAVLVIGGILYAIFGNVHVGPSADVQKPVAIACLKRAGFAVTDEIPTGSALQSSSYGRDVQWKLDVKDRGGASVAILYLADLPEGMDLYAEHLKDDQKTYGDYGGETIEQRGTTVIRLKRHARAGAIHDCVDQAARAKET